MDIKYKFLTHISLEEVQQAWQDGFADYATDMSYMTVDVMRHRQLLGRINYDFSVGAFCGDRLIGILLIGIDEIEEEMWAWDGGTAVVKDYRGDGIASKMFDMCKERLSQSGISNFVLEVFQDNTPAVNTYKKAGFKVSREFEVLSLDFSDFENGIYALDGVAIKQLTYSELLENWHLVKHNPGWEHKLSGIIRGFDELLLFGAYKDGKVVGFIIYSPVVHWVSAIGWNEDIPELGKLLLTYISSLSKGLGAPRLRWDNLEPCNIVSRMLKECGAKVLVKQYEMVNTGI